ncbi:hypothetical protein ACPYO6_07860 [Georgenia sp. Z1344]|uniref:hypothetical protein n=1 Tax=Georgenia sp. Z1344 TaxID=3416706 RepID=UPI003CEECDDC
MRRVTAALTAAVLACLGLAACGEDDDRPSAEGGTGATWQDPVPAGEPVEIAGASVTVEETEIELGEEDAGEGEHDEPGEGRAHVTARVSVDLTDAGGAVELHDTLVLDVLGADGHAPFGQGYCSADDSLSQAASDADDAGDDAFEGSICVDVPADLVAGDGAQWLLRTGRTPDEPEARFASFDDRLPAVAEPAQPDLVDPGTTSAVAPVPVGRATEVDGLAFAVSESTVAPPAVAGSGAGTAEVSTRLTLTNTGDTTVDIGEVQVPWVETLAGRMALEPCARSQNGHLRRADLSGHLVPGGSISTDLCVLVPEAWVPVAAWGVGDAGWSEPPGSEGVRQLELDAPDAPAADPADTVGHLPAAPAATGQSVRLSDQGTVSAAPSTVEPGPGPDPRLAAHHASSSLESVSTVLTVTNTGPTARTVDDLVGYTAFVMPDGATRRSVVSAVGDDAGADPRVEVGESVDVRLATLLPEGPTDGVWLVGPGSTADGQIYGVRYLAQDETGAGVDLADTEPAESSQLGDALDVPASAGALVELAPWQLEMGPAELLGRDEAAASGVHIEDDVPSDAVLVVAPVTTAYLPGDDAYVADIGALIPVPELVGPNGEVIGVGSGCRPAESWWWVSGVLAGGRASFDVCAAVAPEDVEGAVWRVDIALGTRYVALD